jgi:hypothetical protein
MDLTLSVYRETTVQYKLRNYKHLNKVNGSWPEPVKVRFYHTVFSIQHQIRVGMLVSWFEMDMKRIIEETNPFIKFNYYYLVMTCTSPGLGKPH